MPKDCIDDTRKMLIDKSPRIYSNNHLSISIMETIQVGPISKFAKDVGLEKTMMIVSNITCTRG